MAASPPSPLATPQITWPCLEEKLCNTTAPTTITLLHRWVGCVVAFDPLVDEGNKQYTTHAEETHQNTARIYPAGCPAQRCKTLHYCPGAHGSGYMLRVLRPNAGYVKTPLTSSDAAPHTGPTTLSVVPICLLFGIGSTQTTLVSAAGSPSRTSQSVPRKVAPSISLPLRRKSVGWLDALLADINLRRQHHEARHRRLERRRIVVVDLLMIRVIQH